MAQLDYNYRTQAIGKWLQATLKRYTPPQGMTNETLLQEMKFIVQDVNGIMPNHVNDGLIDLFLERTDRQVRAIHGARNWPSVKVFVTAAKSAADETNRAVATEGKSEWDFNPFTAIEKRIKAKDYVPVDYLYGRLSHGLVHTTTVTDDELDEYRFTYETRLKEEQGDKTANATIEELTSKHNTFKQDWHIREASGETESPDRNADRKGRWQKARHEYIPMAQRVGAGA